MITRIFVRLRWLRRKLSRSHLAARLFGAKEPAEEPDLPGLIMIQVDGLSRKQLEQAMENGRLPHLSRLLKRRHFTLESFYSGIPSTTPAVQGEIFYGVRTAVPAFQFLRKRTGQVLRMIDSGAVAEIEKDLEKRSPDPPLLKDGHSYLNIYRAGSRRSRYCAQDFAPDELIRHLHPLKWVILSIVYMPTLMRIAALSLLELGLAVVDVFRGLYERKSFFKEIQFVPTRVAVVIVLRELLRFRLLMDIERGVRICHANFLGYDEQAHRRGPDSAFAHWTLLGIDRAVRDIYRAAQRAPHRDYELIVYSDHGQERTISFARRWERTLVEALGEVFSSGPLEGTPIGDGHTSTALGQTLDLRRTFLGTGTEDGKENSPEKKRGREEIVVTAKGPVGHLYVPRKLGREETEAYAKALVATAGVPLVLVPGWGDGPRAYNTRGEWLLPENQAEVFGPDHPFLNEVAEDTARLLVHPDVGDFVIVGWDPDGKALSFARENGAHGGPGYEETHGFLMVPDRIRRWHIEHLPETRTRVRGEELRAIGLHFLGRDGPREERVRKRRVRTEPDTEVRVMTYNIHSCLGTDGKTRPERVARVINDFDPDIAAIQEVDIRRPRSGVVDQARTIADHLRMEHAFYALLEEEEERYGIAVFTRFRFELKKSGLLTPAGRRREARGAIWLRVLPDGRPPFHFINTHFGLRRGERHRQAAMLLGDEWLGAIPRDERVILCGDFNSGPRSGVVRRLQNHLELVETRPNGERIRASFPSVQPFLRLDHVFASPGFKLKRVEVLRTPTAVAASDHLPIGAEFNLPNDDAAT